MNTIDQEWLRLAADRYERSNDDIEIAEEICDPIDFNVSEADDGAWVLAWVWVPRPEEEED